MYYVCNWVHSEIVHVNRLATLYKMFRHPPYGRHVIKLHVCAAAPGILDHSFLFPEVDESTIQLPSLLLVVYRCSVSPLEV